MIDVVEEKLESTIRHTLEVDYVGLTTNTHSNCDNWMDSCSWLSARSNNNTMGAYIREELTYCSRDVAMLVPNAIIKRYTLAMVCLVDLPQVDEKPLHVSRLLKIVERNRRYIHCSTFLWVRAKNQHRTITNCKHMIFFQPLVCVNIPC